MKSNSNSPQRSVLTPEISGQEVAKGKLAAGKKRTFPKTDFRYWELQVLKNSYVEAGVKVEAKTYSVRIAHRGHRHRFPLHVAELRSAAKKARDIYLRILTEGWDLVLKDFRQDEGVEEIITAPLTVGEYIEAARGVSSAGTRTLADYERSLRTIVASVAGLEGTTARFGPGKGGSGDWRAKVDAQPLDILTPEAVQAWTVAYVRKAGTDAAARSRRQNSCNSILRMAKGLFAKDIIALLKTSLKLPEPLPLVAAKGFSTSAASVRYRSKVDAAGLLKEGIRELAEEPLKAFLLALCCGLRRGELDNLLWRNIDLERRIVRIEANQYWSPKSAGSSADVDIDDELVTILRGFKARATSEYVLASELKPMAQGRQARYRAIATFAALSQWLKSKGLESRTPLHTLRKEAGSLVAQGSGLYAAQRFLRHASPEITARFYLDSKARISTGLGAILSAGAQSENVTPIKAPAEPELKEKRAVL